MSGQPLRLVLLALMLLGAGPALGQQKACDEDLLRKTQADYQSLSGFKAGFTQRDLRPNGAVSEARGIIEYLKPGRMRWEYLEPDEQLLVTDGNTLWLYDPLLDNVTVQPLRDLARGTPLSFLLGLGSLAEDFTCRKLSTLPPDDGLHYLELLPVRPIPSLSYLQVGVHAPAGRLAALRMMDLEGGVRTVRLEDLQTAVVFGENRFSFSITPEMEVIRRDDS